MSAGGEGTVGAGTSESASAGCSLSERLRPSQKNIFARRALPNLDGLAVFTWGRGEDGQLGLGDTSDQDEPTYVDALRGVGVRQIACGSGHTVVLTTDGEVYTWVRLQNDFNPYKSPPWTSNINSTLANYFVFMTEPHLIAGKGR